MELLMEKLSNRVDQYDHKVLTGVITVLLPPGPSTYVFKKLYFVPVNQGKLIQRKQNTAPGTTENSWCVIKYGIQGDF